MQTVPGQPTSVASGILDNETYDGFAVLRAQIETGGWPVVVSEADLVAGRDEGRVQTGLNLDATGAAGLAAALAARQAGDIAPEATCAVLLTGTQR
jgi:threonine synthase